MQHIHAVSERLSYQLFSFVLPAICPTVKDRYKLSKGASSSVWFWKTLSKYPFPAQPPILELCADTLRPNDNSINYEPNIKEKEWVKQLKKASSLSWFSSKRKTIQNYDARKIPHYILKTAVLENLEEALEYGYNETLSQLHSTYRSSKTIGEIFTVSQQWMSFFSDFSQHIHRLNTQSTPGYNSQKSLHRLLSIFISLTVNLAEQLICLKLEKLVVCLTVEKHVLEASSYDKKLLAYLKGETKLLSRSLQTFYGYDAWVAFDTVLFEIRTLEDQRFSEISEEQPLIHTDIRTLVDHIKLQQQSVEQLKSEKINTYNIEMAEFNLKTPSEWVDHATTLSLHLGQLHEHMSSSQIDMQLLLKRCKQIVELIMLHPSDNLLTTTINFCSDHDLLKIAEGLVVNLPMVMNERQWIKQLNHAIEHCRNKQAVPLILESIFSTSQIKVEHESDTSWWNSIDYLSTIKQQCRMICLTSLRFNWDVYFGYVPFPTSSHAIPFLKSHASDERIHQIYEKATAPHALQSRMQTHIASLKKITEQLTDQSQISSPMWTMDALKQAVTFMNRLYADKPSDIPILFEQPEATKMMIIITAHDLKVRHSYEWIASLAQAIVPNQLTLSYWATVWENVTQSTPSLIEAFDKKFRGYSHLPLARDTRTLVTEMMKSQANATPQIMNHETVNVHVQPLFNRQPDMKPTLAPESEKPSLAQVCNHFNIEHPEIFPTSIFHKLLSWLNQVFGNPKYAWVSASPAGIKLSEKAKHDILLYIYKNLNLHASIFPYNHIELLQAVATAFETKSSENLIKKLRTLRTTSVHPAYVSEAGHCFMELWFAFLEAAICKDTAKSLHHFKQIFIALLPHLHIMPSLNHKIESIVNKSEELKQSFEHIFASWDSDKKIRFTSKQHPNSYLFNISIRSLTLSLSSDQKNISKFVTLLMHKKMESDNLSAESFVTICECLVNLGSAPKLSTTDIDTLMCIDQGKKVARLAKLFQTFRNDCLDVPFGSTSVLLLHERTFKLMVKTCYLLKSTDSPFFLRLNIMLETFANQYPEHPIIKQAKPWFVTGKTYGVLYESFLRDTPDFYTHFFNMDWTDQLEFLPNIQWNESCYISTNANHVSLGHRLACCSKILEALTQAQLPARGIQKNSPLTIPSTLNKHPISQMLHVKQVLTLRLNNKRDRLEELAMMIKVGLIENDDINGLVLECFSLLNKNVNITNPTENDTKSWHLVAHLFETMAKATESPPTFPKKTCLTHISVGLWYAFFFHASPLTPDFVRFLTANADERIDALQIIMEGLEQKWPFVFDRCGESLIYYCRNHLSARSDILNKLLKKSGCLKRASMNLSYVFYVSERPSQTKEIKAMFKQEQLPHVEWLDVHHTEKEAPPADLDVFELPMTKLLKEPWLFIDQANKIKFKAQLANHWANLPDPAGNFESISVHCIKHGTPYVRQRKLRESNLKMLPKTYSPNLYKQWYSPLVKALFEQDSGISTQTFLTVTKYLDTWPANMPTSILRRITTDCFSANNMQLLQTFGFENPSMFKSFIASPLAAYALQAANIGSSSVVGQQILQAIQTFSLEESLSFVSGFYAKALGKEKNGIFVKTLQKNIWLVTKKPKTTNLKQQNRKHARTILSLCEPINSPVHLIDLNNTFFETCIDRAIETCRLKVLASPPVVETTQTQAHEAQKSHSATTA